MLGDDSQRMLHDREVLRQELHALGSAAERQPGRAAVPTANADRVARVRRRACGRARRHAARCARSAHSEIESGIESLALDLAFGYGERGRAAANAIEVQLQYHEHYFLLRRRVDDGAHASHRRADLLAGGFARGACMLSREMHNRRSSTPRSPAPA